MDHTTIRGVRRRPVAAALAALAILSFAVAACGSATPTVTLTNPAEILQKGASSLGAMKTFHLRGAVDGQVPLSIGGTGGGAPLTLDGTTLDGDVDVASGELAVELVAPGLLNLKVDLVATGGTTYLRAPIVTGGSWVRQPTQGGVGSDPGAAVAGLAAFLARPELQPQKLADARCAGTDCYSVRFTVPASEIRGALGALGSSIPGLSGSAVGDATVTVGVRKDNLQLATIDLEVPAGGEKPLSIALELSKVNEAVTITPPPADQVKDAPGG